MGEKGEINLQHALFHIVLVWFATVPANRSFHQARKSTVPHSAI